MHDTTRIGVVVAVCGTRSCAGTTRQAPPSDRDGAKEHRRLEEAVPARDADAAAAVLVQHLTLTAAALTDGSDQAP